MKDDDAGAGYTLVLFDTFVQWAAWKVDASFGTQVELTREGGLCETCAGAVPRMPPAPNMINPLFAHEPMDTARWYLSRYPSPYAAYIAMQCAFMKRYVARGGTEEDFCSHLGAAYRRKYGPVFFGASFAGARDIVPNESGACPKS